MVEPNQDETYRQLCKFYTDLQIFQAYLVQYGSSKLTRKELQEMDSLRQSLVRRSGALGPVIKGLTGKDKIQVIGKGADYSYDMWQVALMSPASYRTRKSYERTLRALIICIETTNRAIGSLELNPPKKTTGQLSTRKVFIIHGRDEEAKQTVARFLEKLGLDPIILHEQPSIGSVTLFEKIERHSDVSYALALLTPDDIGRRKYGKTFVPRARQNVILELGYFIGRLGRDRVSAIYWDKVELPTDYEGVPYIPYDNKGGWCLILARELKASGLEVDLSRVC